MIGLIRNGDGLREEEDSIYSNKTAQESSYAFAIGLCLFLK